MGYREYDPAAGNEVESMRFGKMTTQIPITQNQVTLDGEGFQTESSVVIADVRA